MESELRRLPSVDKVISDERIKQLGVHYPHDLIVDLVRRRLEEARLAIKDGNPSPSLDKIVNSVRSMAEELAQLSLQKIGRAHD